MQNTVVDMPSLTTLGCDLKKTNDVIDTNSIHVLLLTSKKFCSESRRFARCFFRRWYSLIMTIAITLNMAITTSAAKPIANGLHGNPAPASSTALTFVKGEESFNGGNVAPGGRLSFGSSLSGGETGVRLSSVVLLGVNVGQDTDEVDGDALPTDGGNESCSLDP